MVNTHLTTILLLFTTINTWILVSLVKSKTFDFKSNQHRLAARSQTQIKNTRSEISKAKGINNVPINKEIIFTHLAGEVFKGCEKRKQLKLCVVCFTVSFINEFIIEDDDTG